MIVGSIETKWAGEITPNKQTDLTNWDYSKENIMFERGMEMGSFKLGSTVILLFPEKTVNWDATLQQNTPIKMGQRLGEM